MRWKEKEYNFPKLGAKRECKGFLWLPIKINKETRWLEFSIWEEELFCVGTYIGGTLTEWKKNRWIN